MQLSKKTYSRNLGKGILILEKVYHINVYRGQEDRE